MFRARAFENSRSCFETVPRDDHSSPNQPKRVGNDRHRKEPLKLANFAPFSCPETVPLKVEDRGDAPREVAVGGLVGGPQAVAAPVEQGPQQGREGVPEGQALRVDGQERLALDAGLDGHERRGESKRLQTVVGSRSMFRRGIISRGDPPCASLAWTTTHVEGIC